MNSWKSPGLRYQWALGNSTSIRLHSNSAVTNKSTVLNTEHVGMHWAATSITDFWSEAQISDVLPAVCCRPLPALPRQKHSSLSYFNSSYPVCCFVRSVTRRRTDSCLSCPSSCFHFVLPPATIQCSWRREMVGKFVDNSGENPAIQSYQVLMQKLCIVSLVFKQCICWWEMDYVFVTFANYSRMFIYRLVFTGRKIKILLVHKSQDWFFQ